MAKIICFSSQKGGVGKTTSSVNLAMAFAVGGYSVLLVDLDPQSSVKYSFGLPESTMGTRELFSDPAVNFTDLVTPTQEHENLSVITSNINSYEEKLFLDEYMGSHDLLHNVFANNLDKFDIVVLDAPASMDNLSMNALYASDYIILPTQCENLSINSIKYYITSFRAFQAKYPRRDIKLAGILLTFFDQANQAHQKTSSILYANLSDAVFETIIPMDSNISLASDLKTSVISYNRDSIGSIAFILLMNELLQKFEF